MTLINDIIASRLSLLRKLLEELDTIESRVDRDGIVVAKEKFYRWRTRAAEELRANFNETEAAGLESIEIPVRTDNAGARRLDDIKLTIKKCIGYLAGDVARRTCALVEGSAAKAKQPHDERKSGLMTEKLYEFLQELARARGRSAYHPDGNTIEALRAFQDDVDTLEELQREGLLNIVGKPHRESSTGHGYADLIFVELTGLGAKTFSRTTSELKSTVTNQPA